MAIFTLKNIEFGQRCKGDTQTKMYVTQKEPDLSLHLVLSNYKLYAHLDLREYFHGL